MTISHWKVQNSSPPEVHQWSGSPGYEPSSVTGHDPIVMTISTSGAKVHNLKDTHSKMDSTHGSKQRSSSSESDHETSVMDSMKKKKHKKRRSANRSPASRAISFSMRQPPDSMVKDYNWMLADTAGDAVPDQSNLKVIIVNEPPEGIETDHSEILLLVLIWCLVHVEGIIPLSLVTADNDPLSEVLSTDNFTIPGGGYPAPYVPENFQGLFLPKPRASGILTCGYHHTRLRDHPLHCQGHSYTEASSRVGMYPTRLGLVETGVGYTETVCIVRKGKEKYHTAVRKSIDLFKQSGYQAATVDTFFLIMRKAPS